jgi:hypothetical protein
MNKYRENIVNMESFQVQELPYWIQAQDFHKNNIKPSRPSNQPPFYVEVRQKEYLQPISFDPPRINY